MYTPTIGLEIHAELKTDSKMFCGCRNNPNEVTPNINICPICMAHPGTLPVINKKAMHHVLRVGSAVSGSFADFTEFDRKNYFYPDIPKNYQISQYKYPLISGGYINNVSITRIHLEEDTARSIHTEKGSLVDYNRAGVPLMELVTDPVIHSAEDAVLFAKELRLILLYLGASDANLEKGEMRIEANVSVSREDGVFGTKVEVKNLNSFKAVEQAIRYEIKRQIEVLERGEKVVQETRGWDENKQKTFSQRLKEESHDYRYYPDPDLPKLYLSSIEGFEKESITNTLPELPNTLRNKYRDEGLRDQIIELLVGNIELNVFYQKVITYLDKNEFETARNYITSDIQGLLSKSGYSGKSLAEMNPQEFSELIKMIHSGSVSSRGAKDILAVWVLDGGKPQDIARENNLIQVSDESSLREIIQKVLDENQKVLVEYRNGKEASLQFLIGQCMRATKGSANPEKLRILIIELSKN